MLLPLPPAALVVVIDFVNAVDIACNLVVLRSSSVLILGFEIQGPAPEYASSSSGKLQLGSHAQTAKP